VLEKAALELAWYTFLHAPFPEENTPTNKTQIAGALSIYDNYCASAGYPRNVVAVTTVTNPNAGNPGTTVVTGDVV
jgi:hypothetical protein